MIDLDDLFAQAAQDVRVPDALMARVLADAAREQPSVTAPLRPRQPIGRPLGIWAALTGLFGGGGVLAGLGSAAVAGLYLGLVQPTAFASITDTVLNSGTVASMELMPGIDALWSEE